MHRVSRHRATRRRPLWIALGVVAALLILAVIWVVARGLMARDELLGALPLARSIEAQVVAGDTDIADDVDKLSARTENARELTSDPVWRALEVVPWAGQNLRAFRQAAATVDDVAQDALPPLVELAGAISLEALTPSGGSIDLEVLRAAAPALAEADAALRAANERASAISTEGTLPQLAEAVDELVALVGETAALVDGLETAATLLPPMLGGEGERDYLMLFMTNAEVRAGAGIPGALAVMSADDGALSLEAQSTAGGFAPPALPLTDTEVALFSDVMASYMQNVTSTPVFSRSAEIAQEIWRQRTGETVDGVIGVDVGALALVLEATGPVTLSDGVELTSDNALDVLLSEVYAKFPDTRDQDAYFADAARRIFAAVTGDDVNPTALISALAEASAERRLLLWSDVESEQAQLERLGLDGGLPESSDSVDTFGVYFNDSTGAKMNYYLDTSITIAAGICRNDERPSHAVSVRLSSDAPRDAAESLPEYVTGGGWFGVPPGIIRTKVYVYPPAGSTVYDVRRDGESVGFLLTEHEGLPAVAVTVDLAPGETATFTVLSVGAEPGLRPVALEHTPLAREASISLDAPLDCATVQPAQPGTAEAIALGPLS